MTHQRQTIREKVVQLLSGAAIVTGGVFGARDLPVAEGDLPLIVVRTNDETSEPADMSSRVLLRKLEITIELKASNPDDSLVAGDVDAYAEAIESALSEPTLGGVVDDSNLKSTVFAKTSDGEVPIGLLTMKYEATYFA